MSQINRKLFCCLAFVALCGMSLPTAGCIGLTAHTLYWIMGEDKVPAEFEGLKGKRVAVVCVSDSSPYGPDDVTELLENNIELRLRKNVKGIQLVGQQEIKNWFDNHNWNNLDFRRIGRGVDADMVLAVELSSYSLHDGDTLYKGRANVVVSVYDMERNGSRAFTKRLSDFEFPRNSSVPAISMPESRFRSVFLGVLGEHVAHQFYAYPIKSELAQDASAITQ